MTSKAELDRLTGGLSAPSKMPCHGWSIPAAQCAIGSLLAKAKGTPCSKCYAKKGRYVFANVQSALKRRLAAWIGPYWVGAMVESIQRTGDAYFRWYDSGDIQGIEMLDRIASIAERTPGVTHWVPTQEHRIAYDYAKAHGLPHNLTIRLSSRQIGKLIVSVPRDNPELVYSGVDLPDNIDGQSVYHCPAPKQGNKCGACRACWNRKVPIVSYHAH